MKDFDKYCVRFAVLCSFLFQLAKAQTKEILLDFGSSATQTASTTTDPKFWNQIHESNFSSGSRNLLTTSRASTGISIRLNGVGGVNSNGSTITDSLALGSLSRNSATMDSFFVGSGLTMSIYLSNLPPNGNFRMTFYASRDATDVRHTRFTVIGSETLSLSHQTSGSNIGVSPQFHANNSRVSRFDSIRPRPDGTVQIDVTTALGTWAYINALSIELINDVPFLEARGEASVYGSPRQNSSLSAKHFALGAPSNARYVWQSVTTIGNTPETIFESSVNGSTYTPSVQDVGKFIRCLIIPDASVQQSGFLTAVSDWIGPIRPSNHVTIFHVGNSLTRLANIPLQLENLSKFESSPSLAGFQLADGKTIRYHWDNGLINGGDLSAGTRSREQISTRSWDILVIQAQSQEWQTATSQADLLEYSRRFYQLADSGGKQMYLYVNWPWQDQALSTQDQINTAYAQVANSISINGQRPVLLIPAGQALRAVVEACGTGALVGYSRSSFYFDNVHQSPLGGYVTALTHYATIYKKSPVGLPATTLSALAENRVVTIPTTVASRIQQIVWDVVRTYPNSGVTNTGTSDPTFPPVTPTTPPPVVSPPEVVNPPAPEPDPPFVTESTTPSNPSLLAHAFGVGSQGSPAVLQHMPKPVGAPPSGQFAVEYTLNPVAESDGVVYTPHWSYDLKNWTATQPANTVITRTDNTVRISWPNSSRWRFLRIHVAQPAQ